MIWLIIKKDFLRNFISAKFAIGFLLCLILIPFSIMLSVNDYGDRVRLFQADQEAADKEWEEIRVYSKLRPEIVKSLEALSVFSQGISNSVGHKVKIQIGEKPILAEGKASTSDNPLLNAFFTIDFTGIIAIVMSLMALIFSYDLCTREKEDGTLRLQLSNSLSRGTLLAGKVLGVLVTLLPILIFCFLLGAVIIVLSPKIALSGLEWLRVILLFFASVVLVAFYSMVGLLVSTRSKSSVSSMVICLFIWVFTAFIIPNTATFMASSFVKTESKDNLDVVINDLHKERSQKIRDYRETLPKPDWPVTRWGSNGGDGYCEAYGCTRSYFEYKRQVSAFESPLIIDYADKKWPLQRAYWVSLQKQRRVAELFSWLSPTGVFRSVADAICLVDAGSQERFLEQIRQYRVTLIQYFNDKEMFSSFENVTPVKPENMPDADQMVYLSTGGEFNTLKGLRDWADTQSSAFAIYSKLKVEYDGSIPDHFGYLNLDDVPRFQRVGSNLITGMQASLFQISVLVFFTVLLFFLAFMAFIRYDVR